MGGDLHPKNEYLGTTTWDICAEYLKKQGLGEPKAFCMREHDVFDIETGTADKPYVPLDEGEMQRYIKEELATIQYPHQLDNMPKENETREQ